MNSDFGFSNQETERIISHFGENFYHKVIKDIAFYTKKWRLSSIRLIDYYSVNCNFTCYSEDYGASVLKIGNPCRETFTEYHTLLEYKDKGFCKVYAADIDNGVIIEELISPGTQLRAEASLDQRLSVFCSLHKDLHIAPEDGRIYPSYMDWVSRITKYMSNRQDKKELYLYMKKAEALCNLLCVKYPRKMLLHGDLHHDNILLGRDNTYTIIDPKGVIGDPIFDVPRFILNEYEDEITEGFYHKINHIIHFLESMLPIPDQVIRQCLFIETAMALCWEVEDGGEPNMDQIIFAEKILNHENDKD
ncbi:MAG: aminoglycoside resistance protein [Herbinix sp.]|jgi:streptomycin 6-kinase|nr:aminoglycoside resistance protein [Herbinix sp.]